MDIIGGIAAAKGAIDIASALRKTSKDFDAASSRAALTDLIEKLTDTRLALVEAKDAISERDIEIGRLKSSFKRQENLVPGDGNYRYFLNEKDERFGMPACPKCEERDSRFVQLKQHVQIDTGKCPACDTEFRPITCYIPASENAGSETTTLAKYLEAERERKERRNAQIARLNSRNVGW